MTNLGSFDKQYQSIIRTIKAEGHWRPTKQVSKITGKTGLMAKTVTRTEIRLQPEDGMPLTTLRNLRGAFAKFVGEMMCIIEGSIHLDRLHRYDIHYWDEFADAEHAGWYGLPKGSLGRDYGQQWRSYNGGGPEPVDQLLRLFKVFERNPYDRSLIIDAWNPYDVDHMVIKFCHPKHQFLLINGRFDLIVEQRSADIPVGIAADLPMYKFWHRLWCMKTGIPEGEYVHSMNDTHYYEDQTEGVEILLDREPRPSPTFSIDPIMLKVLDLWLAGEKDALGRPEINPDQRPYLELVRNWVRLDEYRPHPTIPYEKLPCAV